MSNRTEREGAGRRKANGKTGPRTTRGKRRSSLNRLKRGLCPGWVAQQLRARGENPEDFRRLHRDLIGYLGPEDARSRVVVEALAEAWWEKMRRLRAWVGAGPCDTKEIDAQIDDLVNRLVWAMRYRHRQWRYRLESVLGRGLYGPSIVRQRLESRVRALGGKPAARRPGSRRRDPLRNISERLEGLKEILNVMHNRPAPPASAEEPPEPQETCSEAHSQ